MGIVSLKQRKDAGQRSIEISTLDLMKAQTISRISRERTKMFKMREIVGEQWSHRPTHCNLFDTPTLQSAAVGVYRPTTPTIDSALHRCFSCQNDLCTLLAWPS